MAFKYNIVRVFEEDRAEAIAEGMAKGKAEGKAEGKVEDILDLLDDVGIIPEKLREKLMSQSDLGILKKWHKIAARAHTVEEFEEQICRRQ